MMDGMVVSRWMDGQTDKLGIVQWVSTGHRSIRTVAGNLWVCNASIPTVR